MIVVQAHRQHELLFKVGSGTDSNWKGWLEERSMAMESGTWN